MTNADAGPYADVHENGGIEGYEPEFVDVNGIRTRHYDIGDRSADTLVLVHGGNWSGLSNANTWSTTFGFLSEHFRVVAFDRLGCGMTDNPADVEDFRYQPEIDHALGFFETMGIESCHIAGSSRGGGTLDATGGRGPQAIPIADHPQQRHPRPTDG